MKKQYKILCLTDHRHHSAENSIYELLKTMSAHPGAKYVDVATRGDSRNDDFFFGLQTDQLYVSRVEATFSYAKAFDTWSLAHKRPLSHYDIILLRLPRPIPDGFLTFLRLISLKMPLSTVHPRLKRPVVRLFCRVSGSYVLLFTFVEISGI